MTIIQMRRESYQPSTEIADHAGMFLLKGFKEWDLGGNAYQAQDTGDNHNKAIADHHKSSANIKVSALYEQAYKRWKAHLIKQDDNCGHWFGKLVGRLYLGLGEASPLEAGITLHHTYGVPFIPGSAIKGVLHHYAITTNMKEADMKIIFGEEPDPKNKKSGEAGYAIFNDAWWIPRSGNPLAPEVVTVHHQNYYTSGGENPATDFDDPNPNPQIAIRGSFHFSFLADKDLHDVVQRLLKGALQYYGIGGKVSSGYGLFTEDTSNKNVFDADKAYWKEQKLLDDMSELEREIYKIEKNSHDPAITLFQKLEDDHWHDVKDKDAVAHKIQELWDIEKKWLPYSNVTNRQKVKQKERCLKVVEYFMKND